MSPDHSPPTSAGPLRRRRTRVLVWIARLLGLGLALSVLGHLALERGTRMSPPLIESHQLPRDEPLVRPTDDPSRLELGPSYLRRRGAIREIRLVGSPEEIGYRHARLAYPELVAIERSLHEQFQHFVPLAPLRWALVDLARWRFRALEGSVPSDRRRELGAQALGFDPDPFSGGMPTYQRFVFLSSLYDIMLSFEHSPLVGCSSFALRGDGAGGGHHLLGRNFDFEGPQILDDRKAVFLVLETGRIPYATVSWPGFVGAASGMNAAGLGIVVHGARAREPQPQGVPVASTVRDLLGQARSVAEALELLGPLDPMVSHMLLLADGSGAAAVVERAPGEPIHVRRGEGSSVALTNHYEGPLASDPANLRVRDESTSVPRRRRLDELLENVPDRCTVERAVKILRDKRGVGGVELPLGHRHAIDGLVATHSIVMDLSDRDLWVSEGPHAAGRYLRFDLATLLTADAVSGPAEPIESIAADEILSDGRLQAWQHAGAPHPLLRPPSSAAPQAP